MGSANSVTLFLAAGVFLVYLANVVAGAVGGTAYLSDVAEMITLFVACVLFVIAVLARERARETAAQQTTERNNQGGPQA